MEEKLQTILLEYDKSTFLLDLVKHHNGIIYVAIQQIVQLDKDKYDIHKIRINPTILPDIIEVLNQYKEELPIDKLPAKNYFSAERIQEIIKRYLKGGVEIKHLAMQFDCSETIIEQILRNKGIEIVSNKIPNKVKFWRKKRKKITYNPR
ncbi:MAG: hypothetical protein M0R21_06770 [Lentimicrobiaceae bacterium]|nr:hypothetical protein [Lentimicrobiaceae bacterium]